jgi:hypothetical protein
MNSLIVTGNFFLYEGFFALFSCLIASFMGVSVMGHGIIVGNIVCKFCNLLKSLIADVRFDLKSNQIF